MKILFVEDNKMNQRIVLLSLKKYNHDITIANDGIEAISKFNETTFDCILMDLMMPNMDGFEATINIREIERVHNLVRCPIIALTANDLAGTEMKCFSIGMDGFLTKPFNFEKLHLIFKEFNLE